MKENTIKSGLCVDQQIPFGAKLFGQLLGWSDAEHIPVLAGLNPIKSGILGAAVSVFKKAFQNEPPI